MSQVYSRRKIEIIRAGEQPPFIRHDDVKILQRRARKDEYILAKSQIKGQETHNDFGDNYKSPYNYWNNYIFIILF